MTCKRLCYKTKKGTSRFLFVQKNAGRILKSRILKDNKKTQSFGKLNFEKQNFEKQNFRGRVLRKNFDRKIRFCAKNCSKVHN